MFKSSCYWPPVPIDTPLNTPWSDNITTFADALLSRIPNLPSHLIPTAVPIVDRCWCDFSNGLFEPFNTTRWEVNSVEKLARQLEVKMLEESGREREDDAVEVEVESASSAGVPVDESKATPSPSLGILGNVWPFTRASPHNEPSPSLSSRPPSTNETAGRASQAEQRQRQAHSSTPLQKLFPGLRREYDLRQYGFDVVVDFGWSR